MVNSLTKKSNKSKIPHHTKTLNRSALQLSVSCISMLSKGPLMTFEEYRHFIFSPPVVLHLRILPWYFSPSSSSAVHHVKYMFEQALSLLSWLIFCASTLHCTCTDCSLVLHNSQTPWIFSVHWFIENEFIRNTKGSTPPCTCKNCVRCNFLLKYPPKYCLDCAFGYLAISKAANKIPLYKEHIFLRDIKLMNAYFAIFIHSWGCEKHM